LPWDLFFYEGGTTMPVVPYKKHQPELGEGVFIAPGAHVIGQVEVGARSSIWFNAVVRGDMDKVTIGEESNLQDNVTVHVDEGVPTIIGSRVTVGHNVVLHGCTVEDGVLVGMGSVILNGAVIGRDSLVGAGSLITPGTIIPPRSLVLGSPGRVTRSLGEDQIPVKDAMYRRYMDLAQGYRGTKSG
jgi:carbonic anhydrase/acetyltransferase-like protein (isoleucine patch superfamily)